MHNKALLYALTFAGLYLELAGAFLLSAEAIGHEHLLRIAAVMRRRRVLSFMVVIVLVVILVAISKILRILHSTEVIILMCSLGLLYDFAPWAITNLVKRLGKGTAGILGFALFSIGFVLQAYVSLSLLY